ncbi:MAG: riboflavin synthase [Armatimonadota bacterium]
MRVVFTGLVEEIGVVRTVQTGTVTRLSVCSRIVSRKASVGDSVSVSGVCLTVTSVYEDEISFDAVPETLYRSTLNDLQAGDLVNLESSLRADGVIGGHFVMGHVDAVGVIESVERLADSAQIRVGAPEDVMRYVVEKGSIAVDGVSLTVAAVQESSFSVAVIPHTLKVSTLGRKRSGDRVNLEVDIIAKYVEKFLKCREVTSGVTMDFLRDTGFI